MLYLREHNLKNCPRVLRHCRRSYVPNILRFHLHLTKYSDFPQQNISGTLLYQAKMTGSGFILHFDGNLWAGSQIIPGDPRPQNKNGKLFQEFLERNPHLSVVNALPQCEGLITRSRMKNGVL